MTEPALVLAPLVCAAVLLLSGAAKVPDIEGTRSSFLAMRVPPALTTTAVVRAVPIAEVALGLLLLVTWGWVLAIVGAMVTVLFATYWVLVLRVVRSGEDVDCGCFGAVGDDKVTSTTLVRNSLLVVLAALATGFGVAGSGVVPMLGDLGSAEAWWLVMAAAAAATAVLVVGLRRDEPADAVMDDDELLDYERTPIPFAVLQDADGNTKTLKRLAETRPQLLLFLSTTCSPCHQVAAQVDTWVSRLGPVEVHTVYSDALDRVPEGARAPGAAGTWHDVENGATRALAAGGRPAAVLLGADGQLAGGPVNGKDPVLQFVEDIVAELEGRDPETIATDDPAHEHDPDHDQDDHDHDHDHEHHHAHGHVHH